MGSGCLASDARTARGPRPGLYRAALICGATPLALATILFVGWLVIGGEPPISLGVLLIGGGLLMVIGGAVFLQGARGTSRKRVVLAASLLASNLPVAWAMIWTASWFYTRSEVTVQNLGSERIDRFRLTLPREVHLDLGPIAAGQTMTERFHVQGDGNLELLWQRQSREEAFVVDCYVTHGLGSSWLVRVRDHGLPIVEEESTRWQEPAPRHAKTVQPIQSREARPFDHSGR